MSKLKWQKSSFSGGGSGGDCVEVATGPDGVIHFRESDRPTDVALAARPTWAHFLTHLKRHP